MRRLMTLVLVVGLCGALEATEPAPELLPVRPRPLEDLPVPPGTIIVLRDPRDALGSVQGVVLSAEEYRKLQETIERLRKQATPSRPRVPSLCRFSGKVETRGTQEIVALQVSFEFQASEARSTWLLGFRRALIVRASLNDEGIPDLVDTPEGLTAVVESAGRYTLRLDLELPLQTRGTRAGERGLALNLPGAPITLIDRFDVPAGVTSVRLRPVLSGTNPPSPAQTTTVDARELQREPSRFPAVALGAVDGVEISWDSPAAAGPTEPLLAADGEIVVQVAESFVEVVASLQCRTLRGRQREWLLLTPPGAEVTVPPPTEAPVTITPTNADRSQWRLQARDGEIESLKVEIRSRSTDGMGKPSPVGPFHLVGAFRQQGTVRIIGPNHLRVVTGRPRSDLGPREIPADTSAPTRAMAEFVQASFNYGMTAATAPHEPLLYVDREPIRGEVRVQVSHHLNLSEAGWRLTTDIRAVPIRMELETLEVEVPAVLHPTIEASPRELVEKIERADAASNRWRIRLAHPRRVETAIRLEGLYPRPATTTPATRETATLPLPRLQQVIERDTKVTVAVPEGLDLSGVVREWDRDRAVGSGIALEMQPGQPPTLGGVTSRTAGAIELSWAPQGGSVPVQSTLEATLEPNRAVVRQKFLWASSTGSRQLLLRRQGATAIEPRLNSGGTLTSRGNQEWVVTLPPSTGRENSVTLTWSQPLPATPSRWEMSLLIPVTVGSLETRVRIWSSAGLNFRPVSASAAWESLPPEPQPDRPTLPALNLLAPATPTPLVLDLVETSPVGAGILIDRLLVQGVSAEDRRLHCRTWFVMRNLSATYLEVELPDHVSAGSAIHVLLNGQRLDPAAILPIEASSGPAYRIPLPSAERVDIQILYTLEPREVDMIGLRRWTRAVAAPRFRGPVYIGTVYWYIEQIGDEFALPLTPRAVLEPRWGLQRLMPVPLPKFTRRDLEDWVQGASLNSMAPSIAEATDRSFLVVRQGGLSSLDLLLIPRMTWYFLCSLGLLAAVGLAWKSPSGSWTFWIVGASVLTAFVTLSLAWPDLALLVLAGSPPGLFALIVVGAIRWWQRRQYQRRMVFLPAFERGKSSTSPSRPGSSHRPREVPAVTNAIPE